MIEYLVGENKYVLSYDELKQKYLAYCWFTDEQFLNSLTGALHLACIICFLKEIPTYVCLSDKGIIHELVHLLDHSDSDVKEVRNLFEQQLKLA